MRLRVIALGQAAAGDDGAGPAVLAELGRRGVADGVELTHAADATALLPLLETPDPIVLVDAAVGAVAGQVIELAVEDLASRPVRPVSSHGLDVASVVRLARLLSPERVSPSVRIVAVAIEPANRFRIGLSAAVAAAIPRAADRIVALVNR